MRKALIINPEDNVAVLTEEAKKGDEVVCRGGGGELIIAALSDIPAYHKIAARDIRKGDKVVKYGECIGRATSDIAAGGHVHTHNVESARKAQ